MDEQLVNEGTIPMFACIQPLQSSRVLKNSEGIISRA